MDARIVTIVIIVLAGLAQAATIDNTVPCVTGTGNDPEADIYCSIQDAISDSSPHDILTVAGGPYPEDLEIGKPLTIQGTAELTGIHNITSGMVTISGLSFTASSGHAITLDSTAHTLSLISIDNCTFENTGWASIRIGLTSGNMISSVTIADSTFYGPATQLSNPFKIGGEFGNPGSPAISRLAFVRNIVYRGSIPINLQDADLERIQITDNTFRETDGALYIWGEGTPLGKLSSFEFIGNDIDQSNTYGIGIFPLYSADNFGAGNLVTENSFDMIPGGYGFFGVSNLATGYTLDARYNYWGSASGPSGEGPGTGSAVSAGVDYTPWIGVVIDGLSPLSCTFPDHVLTLRANVTGNSIESVWFSIDGVNQSAIHGEAESYYVSYTTSTGGIFTSWTVHARDSWGRTYTSATETFYVAQRTALTINPESPDGESGWYVSEPTFTLTPDSSLSEGAYYRWGTGTIPYTGPFSLEDIPNAPPIESGGILQLRWHADLGACGTEPEQSLALKIDLKDPVIRKLYPENGTEIPPSSRLNISAYIDEVYQSNSGVREAEMEIDGVPISSSLIFSRLHATITAEPPESFWKELGEHTVRIRATDNSGRISHISWVFRIIESSAIGISVISPSAALSDKRLVPVHITTTLPATLEYINHDDQRPRTRILCRDCLEWGATRARSIRLNEGMNRLTFTATDATASFGHTIFVDSSAPRIQRTLPRQNAVTNGSDFTVRYTEDNLQSVKLVWDGGTVDFTCESGRNIECSQHVDLSSFDGQWITYHFNVSDPVRTVSSRETRVLVDATAPSISVHSPLAGEEYPRRLPFDIRMTEEVTLEYMNLADRNPRWTRLCVRCSDYGSSRPMTRSFPAGTQTIKFRATDAAGHSTESEEITFTVLDMWKWT